MMCFNLVNAKRQTKNRRALWNSDIGHVSDEKLLVIMLRYYTFNISFLILHCPWATGPTDSISPSDLGKLFFIGSVFTKALPLVIKFTCRYLRLGILSLLWGLSQQSFRIRNKRPTKLRKFIKTFDICTRIKYVTKKKYERLFSFWIQIKMRHIKGSLRITYRFRGNRSCRSLNLVFPLIYWASRPGVSRGAS